MEDLVWDTVDDDWITSALRQNFDKQPAEPAPGRDEGEEENEEDEEMEEDEIQESGDASLGVQKRRVEGAGSSSNDTREATAVPRLPKPQKSIAADSQRSTVPLSLPSGQQSQQTQQRQQWQESPSVSLSLDNEPFPPRTSSSGGGQGKEQQPQELGSISLDLDTTVTEESSSHKASQPQRNATHGVALQGRRENASLGDSLGVMAGGSRGGGEGKEEERAKAALPLREMSQDLDSVDIFGDEGSLGFDVSTKDDDDKAEKEEGEEEEEEEEEENDEDMLRSDSEEADGGSGLRRQQSLAFDDRGFGDDDSLEADIREREVRRLGQKVSRIADRGRMEELDNLGIHNMDSARKARIPHHMRADLGTLESMQYHDLPDGLSDDDGEEEEKEENERYAKGPPGRRPTSPHRRSNALPLQHSTAMKTSKPLATARSASASRNSHGKASSKSGPSYDTLSSKPNPAADASTVSLQRTDSASLYEIEVLSPPRPQQKRQLKSKPRSAVRQRDASQSSPATTAALPATPPSAGTPTSSTDFLSATHPHRRASAPASASAIVNIDNDDDLYMIPGLPAPQRRQPKRPLPVETPPQHRKRRSVGSNASPGSRPTPGSFATPGVIVTVNPQAELSDNGVKKRPIPWLSSRGQKSGVQTTLDFFRKKDFE